MFNKLFGMNKGLEETAERLGQDFHEAFTTGATEASVVIQKNKTLVSELIALTNNKEFDKAIRKCDECIMKIESVISEYPPSKKSLTFLLANIYIQKGRSIGLMGYHRRQKDMVEQGLELIAYGIRMTTFPRNARDLALSAYESLAKTIGKPIPVEFSR